MLTLILYGLDAAFGAALAKGLRKARTRARFIGSNHFDPSQLDAADIVGVLPDAENADEIREAYEARGADVFDFAGEDPEAIRAEAVERIAKKHAALEQPPEPPELPPTEDKPPAPVEGVDPADIKRAGGRKRRTSPPADQPPDDKTPERRKLDDIL